MIVTCFAVYFLLASRPVGCGIGLGILMSLPANATSNPKRVYCDCPLTFDDDGKVEMRGFDSGTNVKQGPLESLIWRLKRQRHRWFP
jgi:hypothetical protein